MFLTKGKLVSKIDFFPQLLVVGYFDQWTPFAGGKHIFWRSSLFSIFFCHKRVEKKKKMQKN